MGKFLRTLFWIAAILGIIAGILRLVAFKTWTIPDDPELAASIAPTMLDGDVVIVLTRGTPGFGDLVRCPDPENALRFVVGRIVGVEGDEVETEGPNVVVNGTEYIAESACPIPEFFVSHPSSGAEAEIRCEVVRMGGGSHYRGSAMKTIAPPKTHVTVGEGMVFLMSDDRAFPYDSRRFGAVPRESCSERIVFRVVSRDGWSDADNRLTVIH